jgi:hypothetical protein
MFILTPQALSPQSVYMAPSAVYSDAAGAIAAVSLYGAFGCLF